jgi:spermidine synthase
MEIKESRLLTITFAALFLSGIAGVINQVVWQRALRIFLGGSETISAMIVVLVFMLGLGLGAGLAATKVARIANPLRSFGLVELALFAANLVIAFVLTADLSDSVYAAQKLALSAGIPLRVVYAVASLFILLVPTVLMGATLPLASEACQRQFGATDRLLIPVLFFINSVGAVVGAAGASFYLLPFHGQFASLVTAASMNLFAGLVIIVAARRISNATIVLPSENATVSRGLFNIRREEFFGLVLGFLSLGFEMILLRYMMLAHGPLPYTFATTLCCFLLFWSIGVYIARRFVDQPGHVFLVTAVLIALTPVLFRVDRSFELSLWIAGVLYFLPCLGFGILYGILVARSADRWGTDVGRFYAFNTVGSCAGILFFTLVGYEIPVDHNAWLIGLSLASLSLLFQKSKSTTWKTVMVPVGLAGLFAAIVSLDLKRAHTTHGNVLTYWGRDGVVELDHENGDVVIDGLWHSRLSDGSNHIGRKYSWMMAVAGILAHQQDDISNALVVGNCIGMTATTLSRLDGLQVDAYEINQTIKRVLDDFPDETLGVANNPSVNILWQDGRSGLALSEKKYDLIITAPLHLKQSGSSTLLSQEYLQLIKRRLNPGGVVVLYSYEGLPQQHQLIHQTVSHEFDHTATWLNHLLTIASDSPIDLSRKTMEAKLTRTGRLYDEIRIHQQQRINDNLSDFAQMTDPHLEPADFDYLITDDHPLVEYRSAVAVLLDANPDIVQRRQSK